MGVSYEVVKSLRQPTLGSHDEEPKSPATAGEKLRPDNNLMSETGTDSSVQLRLQMRLQPWLTAWLQSRDRPRAWLHLAEPFPASRLSDTLWDNICLLFSGAGFRVTETDNSVLWFDFWVEINRFKKTFALWNAHMCVKWQISICLSCTRLWTKSLDSQIYLIIRITWGARLTYRFLGPFPGFGVGPRNQYV